MTPLTRRDMIVAGSGVLVGAAVGGGAVGLATGTVRLPGGTPEVGTERWASERTAPYFIGHRGAGGIAPEHTLPSYQLAAQWGAPCIEVSVVMSMDGVLYCHHDLTLDRTTTLKGPTRSKTSAELGLAKVSVPRLGPRWTGSNMPAVPRLKDVLESLKGKAVLCIEPKDDDAYPPLVALVQELGMTRSVIIKLDATSPRIALAKEAGFPVFAYLGNAEVATADAITKLAGRLDPRRDVLVLPARDEHDLLASDIVRAAVRTGIPVWVVPVHRRHEVTYFSRLGVEGMIAACLGYTAGLVPKATADDWASGKIPPGELTRNPYVDAFALDWQEEGVLSIPSRGRPTFVTLGQFCPIEAASYRISFDFTFDPMPSDTWQHMSLAFGHSGDEYYEHKLGESDGYHTLVRADGTMGVYAHVRGETNGTELTPSKVSTEMKPGRWARMTLEVTPDTIRWLRDDGTVLEARDNRFRGGYLHIGSSSDDGTLKVRSFTVS